MTDKQYEYLKNRLDAIEVAIFAWVGIIGGSIIGILVLILKHLDK